MIKNNLSSENIPDRFKMTKFDSDKLAELFTEYKIRLKIRLCLGILFENLKNERWSQAADCASIILSKVTF